MDIRYSANQRDVKRYTTDELRDEFLITNLYRPDEVVCVYSHVDRMVTFGCMPVNEVVSLDKGIDVWHNFGTSYILERREIGIFNIGGEGEITADDETFKMAYKDCLYITKGTKKVTFKSYDPEKPAKFYMVSAPAHTAYKTTFIPIEKANKRPIGAVETANKRVINQFLTHMRDAWRSTCTSRSRRTTWSSISWAREMKPATSSCTMRTRSSARPGPSTPVQVHRTTPSSGRWAARTRRSTIWMIFRRRNSGNTV